MHSPEIDRPDYSILVVAYDDRSRGTLASGLAAHGAQAIPCATFCEAESCALCETYRGILVDLATMIKSKGEEKIVAYTLTGLYPTLRVKTMGSMLVPMAMAGDAKQDNSVPDFLSKSCAVFSPRRLRSHRRKDICIPIYVGAERCFSLTISWGGMFIADMNPERFSVGEEILVTLLDFGLAVDVTVTRVQCWGERRPPGIGVKFNRMGQELEDNLLPLLKSHKDKDRDRKVA